MIMIMLFCSDLHPCQNQLHKSLHSEETNFWGDTNVRILHVHISMRMREREFYNACVIMQSHELNNWVYFCSVQFSKVEEEEWKITFIEDGGASHRERRTVLGGGCRWVGTELKD